MTAFAATKALVLGIFPNARGFGWVVFESPFNLVASGSFIAVKQKNQACLDKIDALCGKYSPETVVLEAFDKECSKRVERIERLCRSIVSLVGDRGHELTIFKRGDVQAAFADVGARTRHEIACATARQVPAMAHRLPKPRKPWECEKRQLAVFNAAALVLTHYRYGATALLEELRNAA